MNTPLDKELEEQISNQTEESLLPSPAHFIKQQAGPDIALIILSATLNTQENDKDLLQTLFKELSQIRGHLIIEVSQISYLSSGLLGLFLSLQAHLCMDKRKLVVTGTKDAGRRLVRLFHLKKFLTFTSNIEKAKELIRQESAH